MRSKNQQPLSAPDKLAMRKRIEDLSAAGKHLEACELLEQLAAQSPRNPLIWNDLGIQYQAAGDHNQAIAALQRAHAADPTYPPALYNLGKFTLDHATRLHQSGAATDDEFQQLLAQAIASLNANLDLDPDNADSHYHLAIAYARSRNHVMAEAHMTLALRLEQALAAPAWWRAT